MGIPDLLKQYTPLIQHIHLSKFKHKTCAVDMMLWLYKGVYASLNNDILTTSTSPVKSDLYLNYPLKMLSLLKAHDITVIAVFDGKIPPAKYDEHSHRLSYKAQNITLAQQLSQIGKDDESKKVFKRTLRIKSRMVNTLVDVLKKMDIDIIIAPYEADAQISYLYKTHQIDFAISEDSDLIPYGVEHIGFKLDVNGNMEYLDISKEHKEQVLPTLMEKQHEVTKFLLSITRLHLVRFCVLLGCDYIASPKGLGIKSCYKLLRTCNTIDTAVHAMKCSGKFKFENDNEEEYIHKAKQAMSVFYLQTVYDNKENMLRPIWNVMQYERTDDTVDDLVTKSFLYEVINGKKVLNDKKEKEYYYGPFFEEFEEYCNGNVDVKTMMKDKKKETVAVIEKYYNKYYLHLTYANCKVMKVEGKEGKKMKEYITIHENKREIDIDNEIRFLKDTIGEDELVLYNNNNKDVLLNRKRVKCSNDEEIFKGINIGDILTQTTTQVVNNSTSSNSNSKYHWMSGNMKKENECFDNSNSNEHKENNENGSSCNNNKDLCFKQYKVINDIIIPKKQETSSNNMNN